MNDTRERKTRARSQKKLSVGDDGFDERHRRELWGDFTGFGEAKFGLQRQLRFLHSFHILSSQPKSAQLKLTSGFYSACSKRPRKNTAPAISVRCFRDGYFGLV